MSICLLRLAVVFYLQTVLQNDTLPRYFKYRTFWHQNGSKEHYKQTTTLAINRSREISQHYVISTCIRDVYIMPNLQQIQHFYL